MGSGVFDESADMIGQEPEYDPTPSMNEALSVGDETDPPETPAEQQWVKNQWVKKTLSSLMYEDVPGGLLKYKQPLPKNAPYHTLVLINGETYHGEFTLVVGLFKGWVEGDTETEITVPPTALACALRAYEKPVQHDTPSMNEALNNAYNSAFGLGAAPSAKAPPDGI